MGNDGIREGNNVYGIIVFREGESKEIHTCGKSLNFGENWSNGSTHQAYIDVPHVKVKDIDGFSVVSSLNHVGCVHKTTGAWTKS